MMQTSLRTPSQQEPGQHHDSVQRKTDGIEAGLGQLGFEDRRPMAVAQRKLSELMDGSPQALQQKSIADGMGVAPQVLQQKAQMEGIQNSARRVGFGLGTVQRREGDGLEEDLASEQGSEEDILQGKFVGDRPAQLVETPAAVAKPNNTGLPDQLKFGIESLSGMSMDHVRVHYNSDKPAQLQAHAYAQGSEIHIGPGQEKHLPHEAWHVVQQAEGRVRATRQMAGGVGVNDDVGLEEDANALGRRAAGMAHYMNDRNSRDYRSESSISTEMATLNAMAPLNSRPATTGSPIMQQFRDAKDSHKENNKHPVGEDGYEVDGIFVPNTPGRLNRSGLIPHVEKTHEPRKPVLKSRFTTKAPQEAGILLLIETINHLEKGIGIGYSGLTEMQSAPSVPMPQYISKRVPADTGRAFKENTGDFTARAHVERHAPEMITGSGFHHISHVGANSNHGGHAADQGHNLVAATSHANGEMIPVDANYPSGFVDLNRVIVQQGSVVAVSIYQSIAHSYAPNTPLFPPFSTDGQRGQLYVGEWEEREELMKYYTQNLEAIHLLQNLNPKGYPTMNQFVEYQEQERKRLVSQYNAPGIEDEKDEEMSD